MEVVGGCRGGEDDTAFLHMGTSLPKSLNDVWTDFFLQEMVNFKIEGRDR